MKRTTLGIIGYGQFGKFIHKYLAEYFEISIFSRSMQGSSFEKAAQCDIVIIAVTFQHFEETVKKVAKYVSSNTLVVDVCSIKEKPIELMVKYLPKEIEILGTHPIFGPQSGKTGIAGLDIVVCPVRIQEEKYQKAKAFLSDKLKLNVIQKTPEEHDRDIAYVLGLSHFIARGLRLMNIPGIKETTKSFKKLLEVRDLLGQDSEELFLTIEKENKYVHEVRKRLLTSLQEVDKKIST